MYICTFARTARHIYIFMVSRVSRSHGSRDISRSSTRNRKRLDAFAIMASASEQARGERERKSERLRSWLARSSTWSRKLTEKINTWRVAVRARSMSGDGTARSVPGATAANRRTGPSDCCRTPSRNRSTMRERAPREWPARAREGRRTRETARGRYHVSRLLNFLVTTLPMSMPSLSTIR